MWWSSGIEALSEGFREKGRYRECRRLFYPAFYLSIYTFPKFVALHGNCMCAGRGAGDKGCPGYIVDQCLLTDTNGNMAWLQFEAMGFPRVKSCIHVRG